ncbi:MAG: hypothetical protein AB7I30_13645, partial [Isosphaeraceae bacterium]
PITIQSQYAEVIYFLRNGNLYRRVLLVAPEYQSALIQANPLVIPAAFGGAGIPLANHRPVVSWLGVNDLSSRPGSTGVNVTDFKLNTLGDLTNRENRYASSRFYQDFDANTDPQHAPDDTNGDGVPDFYPSLHYGALNPARGALPTGRTGYPARLVNEYIPASRPITNNAAAAFEFMAFPYVFPGAYSKPVIGQASAGLGWIHGPDPVNNQLTLASLNQLNHNPIDLGDSLPLPTLAGSAAGSGQTWWGFPTWRETLGQNWQDPVHVLLNGGQPFGLKPRDAISSIIPTAAELTRVPFLPPMNTAYRVAAQPNTDGLGAPFFATTIANNLPANFLWSQSWEDDLILTGVRSFDVKAYDPSFGDYVDLGWGNDLRKYLGYIPAATLANAEAPVLGHRTDYLGTDAGGVRVIFDNFYWPPYNTNNWPPISGANQFNLIHDTFAHEGRIPPRVVDNRPDYQFPFRNRNIGDDNASVVRLRRVWDTWSTDYTNPPVSGIVTNPNDPRFLGKTGIDENDPDSLPIYPSVPPPYPMALRGIQIQVRVVDPRNEHLKVLTIRQDFSDKL